MAEYAQITAALWESSVERANPKPMADYIAVTIVTAGDVADCLGVFKRGQLDAGSGGCRA